MAITRDGETKYVGMVLSIDEHYWLDGMIEENALVWDMETHSAHYELCGYYGSDGCDLTGIHAEVDATTDTMRDVLHTLKRNARSAFAASVVDAKNAVMKGRTVEVIAGRKVKKGTPLTVFWVGERPTYRSQMYSYLHETETIAGCYTEAHEKVWIKAEYLKPTDTLKSPSARERKKFINAYIKQHAKDYNVSLYAYRKAVSNK